MLNMYDFAERLKTFRKKLGLTQQALADAIGVTKSAISSMERGLTNAPTPEHLFKLSSVLHCNPVILLQGKPTSSLKTQGNVQTCISAEEIELLRCYSQLSTQQKKTLFSFLSNLSLEH